MRCFRRLRTNFIGKRTQQTATQSNNAVRGFSPFLEDKGTALNLYQALSFYYLHPHPEITPFVFLAGIQQNQFTQIGMLSHQMRTYPHRISEWTDFLVKSVPERARLEYQQLKPENMQKLAKISGDPLKFLIQKIEKQIAASLICTEDVPEAQYAQGSHESLRKYSLRDLPNVSTSFIFNNPLLRLECKAKNPRYFNFYCKILDLTCKNSKICEHHDFKTLNVKISCLHKFEIRSLHSQVQVK
jgi:hypothetical protein